MSKSITVAAMLIVCGSIFSAYSAEDIFKANERYQKACDLNDGIGCTRLGLSYANAHVR